MPEQKIFIILIIIFLFAALYILMILPNLSKRRLLLPYIGMDFAHRGLHDIEKCIPENSLSAFREALKQRCAIELDIHLTKDKQVVVFHDESLKRICGVEGTIEDSTYEELKMLFLCHTTEHIPLFQEVLDLINGRVPLLIELKLPSQNMELCPTTMDILKDYSGAYLVQSFNSLGIRWFQKHQPEVLRGQLSSALTKTNPEAPFWVRFCAEHLLTNLLCRPDFISYKLADTNHFSLWLNQHLFRVPIAVWTLRTPDAYQKGKHYYDICIFEKPAKYNEC